MLVRRISRIAALVAMGIGISGSAAEAVTAVPTSATPSQAFVDRTGVNIHAGFYSSAYDNFDRNHKSPLPDLVGFQNIETALSYLGIFHVRDAADNPYFLPLYPKMNFDLGTKFDFVLSAMRVPGDTTGNNSYLFKINNALAYPAIVDYVEGPNESDLTSETQLYNSISGLPATLLIQQNTFAAVNATPLLVGRTIQASFANEWDIQDIRPDAYDTLSNVLLNVIPGIVGAANYGNTHTYYTTGHGSRNPGTAFPPYHTSDPTLTSYYQAYSVPFGQNAMMAYNARLLAPGNPVIDTESGYHTTPGNPDAVDVQTQAKYTMTLLFDDLRSGLTRTYLYELADEQPDPTGTNPDYHFGLFNSDWTEKPAAVAIHNLMALMTDSGAPLAGSLSYALSGGASTMGTHLFRRSDGTYVLALWNDVKVCGGRVPPRGVGAVGK